MEIFLFGFKANYWFPNTQNWFLYLLFSFSFLCPSVRMNLFQNNYTCWSLPLLGSLQRIHLSKSSGIMCPLEHFEFKELRQNSCFTLFLISSAIVFFTDIIIKYWFFLRRLYSDFVFSELHFPLPVLIFHEKPGVRICGFVFVTSQY